MLIDYSIEVISDQHTADDTNNTIAPIIKSAFLAVIVESSSVERVSRKIIKFEKKRLEQSVSVAEHSSAIADRRSCALQMTRQDRRSPKRND